MGFIYYQEVPRGIEYLAVLFELTTYEVRTTKVLHGGKVDILISFSCKLFKFSEQFPLIFGTIVVILTVEEYLLEILKPSFIYNRAMG